MSPACPKIDWLNAHNYWFNLLVFFPHLEKYVQVELDPLPKVGWKKQIIWDHHLEWLPLKLVLHFSNSVLLNTYDERVGQRGDPGITYMLESNDFWILSITCLSCQTCNCTTHVFNWSLVNRVSPDVWHPNSWRKIGGIARDSPTHGLSLSQGRSGKSIKIGFIGLPSEGHVIKKLKLDLVPFNSYNPKQIFKGRPRTSYRESYPIQPACFWLASAVGWPRLCLTQRFQ